MKMKYLRCIFLLLILLAYSETGFAQENRQIQNPVSDRLVNQFIGNSGNSSSASQMNDWFVPVQNEHWFHQIFLKADRNWLISYFHQNGWSVPDNTFALIAPVRIQDNQVQMRYFSYGDTAFEFSMTSNGEERYWPASTVKLTAAVLALIKLNEYGLSSNVSLQFNDVQGHFEGTVRDLCRAAIIPSDNTAYNRLMEIAGFDEINDNYLPDLFHYPTMILQRRYVRQKPGDNIRISPSMMFEEGSKKGTLPYRESSGRTRFMCPRESNCTTLAELGETVFRVVFHELFRDGYRFPIRNEDAEMLIQALKEAPSCIGNGVSEVMGNDAIVYNKGGKVIGDDRLEVGIVSSADGREMYLIALSMPYYEGVESETNLLAKRLIQAMRALENP